MNWSSIVPRLALVGAALTFAPSAGAQESYYCSVVKRDAQSSIVMKWLSKVGPAWQNDYRDMSTAFHKFVRTKYPQAQGAEPFAVCSENATRAEAERYWYSNLSDKRFPVIDVDWTPPNGQASASRAPTKAALEADAQARRKTAQAAAEAEWQESPRKAAADAESARMMELQAQLTRRLAELSARAEARRKACAANPGQCNVPRPATPQ